MNEKDICENELRRRFSSIVPHSLSFRANISDTINVTGVRE